MTGWKAPERSTVSTFIICENAMEIVEFAEDVFGAIRTRLPLFRSNGQLWNAEIRIGESTLMLSDATEDTRFPAFVYVQVEDVDATFDKAITAGAREFMQPQDQFYGDRDGGVADKAGNVWWIGTHQKVLSDDEMIAGARYAEILQAKTESNT